MCLIINHDSIMQILQLRFKVTVQRPDDVVMSGGQFSGNSFLVYRDPQMDVAKVRMLFLLCVSLRMAVRK